MKALNIVALVLFIVLLVAVVLIPDRAQVRAQSSFLKIMAPLMRQGSETRANWESTMSDLDTRLNLEAQLEEMDAKLAMLPLIEEENQALRKENQTLKESLNLSEDKLQELIAAKVVQRETSTWWRSVTINRGSDHGVRTDQAVRTAAGIVGKVTLVENQHSQVLLITDEMCRVPAMAMMSDQQVEQGAPAGGQGGWDSSLLGIREYGVVYGIRGGAQGRFDLRMTQLPRESKTQAGVVVYTSGEGGIFPQGIPIGRVQSVEQGDLLSEARLIPEVNFMDLEFVFVIKMQDPEFDVN